MFHKTREVFKSSIPKFSVLFYCHALSTLSLNKGQGLRKRKLSQSLSSVLMFSCYHGHQESAFGEDGVLKKHKVMV